MGFRGKCIQFLVNIFIKTLGLNNANNKLSSYFSENLEPVYQINYKQKKMFFSCRNELTKWRLDTYFSKEVETIEWIDTFKEGEILFDIGANIGLYSIYASKRGMKVIAFEPESQNYALLNRNVYLNKLDDNIVCLNIALGADDRLDYLYLSDFKEGHALHSFGSNCGSEGKIHNHVFKQGAISFTLDSFIEHYPKYFPTHIKIDVDGLEYEILKNAFDTIGDQRVKSLLVEMDDNLPETLKMIMDIESKGFKLLHKKSSCRTQKDSLMNSLNYVFVRQ